MIEEAAGIFVKRTDLGNGDEGAVPTHGVADLMPNVAAPDAAPAPS